jgi:hypothetical protein
MLKRIPKSDISIRPFKAYKEWSFSSGSTQIDVLDAVDGVYTDVDTFTNGNNLQFSQYSLYGQLRAQFYNGQEDNVFTRTGEKRNGYVTGSKGRDRFLNGSAKVISIPNVYIGEGIKKGSLILIDDKNTANEVEYTDDGYGNLLNDSDGLVLNYINIETAEIDFSDFNDNNYLANLNTTIGSFDIELSLINIIYNGQPYTITFDSIDLESGILISNTPLDFLPDDAHGIKIGNVFYNQGLIVITREVATKLSNNWSINFKSTKTIYEHEYLLIAEQDEFNVSTNPTSVVTKGRKTQTHIDDYGRVTNVVSNPGVSYIRKKTELPTGEILDYRYSGSIGNTLAGFEHYEMSSSVDTTGSFLTPFITTIGLYDDNCDLVAVAKLPQPIKSEHDLTVNFIVRFDT